MKTTMLILFVGCASVAFGQFPIAPDSLYLFVRSNSVFRNAVDWKTIDETFRANINAAQSLSDTMNCFVRVLESLHDVHTQMYLNNKYYGHYPSFDSAVLARLKPLNDKAVSLTNHIRTEILPNNIAYLRVPSIQAYSRQQINALAQSLYDSAAALACKARTGYIIDLRLNGGGNLYPMLSGLSSFLGDAVVGYETDIDDSVLRVWEIKSGNFMIGGYQTTEITTSPKVNVQTVPVAVVIGPTTKSSGSMTAIAFKKRLKTIFIGESTADGYTTSNGYFQFAPNLTLNFAVNFVADRGKTTYKTTVNPDIVVKEGDNFDNLTNDAKIIAATKWLTNHRRRH